MTGASVTAEATRAGRRASATEVTAWAAVWPLALPIGLLIAGALIGFPFTLDQPVAAERLIGIVVAGAVALVACLALRRVDRSAAVLLTTAGLALAGSMWVIAASGPDVFRGPIGRVLQTLFVPIFGLAQVTDPVEVANTRFIVGYNGLADLCLVAMFAAGALVLERFRARRWLLLVVALSLLLLVGAGARGGLTGLLAGVAAIGVFAWPRRYALLTVIAAPLAFVVAAVGFLDKGLEFSSTAGRLTYWADLARLLTEYPLTGVGLGVDTAFKATLEYEINPDPERVFYAHNTFVQSYLETGPLGMLGMLLVPLVALAAIVVARRHGIDGRRRALFVAGLGTVAALTVHGLTDQVVTTNLGTGLLLLGLAAAVAALTPRALRVLTAQVSGAAVVLAALAVLVVMGFAILPAGRARALLNFAGLHLNQALDVDAPADARAPSLAAAEAMLVQASTIEASSANLRELARARAALYDDDGALEALKRAAESPNLDAFDTLQVAHLYRDLGFADEAYRLAAQSYAVSGRSTEDAVMQSYAQSTLAVLDDFRARTLAEQAEAAMRARHFGEAQGLFEQALTFQPESAYLQDRLGAARRAVAKYGG